MSFNCHQEITILKKKLSLSLGDESESQNNSLGKRRNRDTRNGQPTDIIKKESVPGSVEEKKLYRDLLKVYLAHKSGLSKKILPQNNQKLNLEIVSNEKNIECLPLN